MKASLRPWAFALVPALGLVELGAHLYFAKRTPTFDEWSVLKEPIAREKKAGELVVIAPAWGDPLARKALGDELMPIRDEGRPDETRYAEALEVSLFGERAPEVRGFRETARFEVGKFTVRRLQNPSPAHVVYDFTQHIGPADADVRGTEPAITCAWTTTAMIESGGLGGHPTFPRERFQCPGGSFFHVGLTTIADEEFRARRCVWSHPLQRGELVTRFHKVPLGAVIRGHGGMYWMIERELAGAPIKLTVRVDGDTIGEAVHVDGDGWKLFELPLGAHANAPAAEVEIAVSSPNYRDRHFCWEADTR